NHCAGLGRALLIRQEGFKRQSFRENSEILYGLARNYLDLPIPSLSQKHETRHREWIIQFAFTLMSSPEVSRDWAGREFVSGINYVLRFRAVLRMCRFTFLLMNLPHQNVGNGQVGKR